jgi:hypothetical protein
MAAKISHRRTFYIVDELGVDPLRDKSIDAILSIQRWQWLDVDQSNEFNLPLIADRYYKDADWWWIILVYNNISDAFAVKRGTRLRMPAPADITSALSEVLLNVSSAPRTISI